MCPRGGKALKGGSTPLPNVPSIHEPSTIGGTEPSPLQSHSHTQSDQGSAPANSLSDGEIGLPIRVHCHPVPGLPSHAQKFRGGFPNPPLPKASIPLQGESHVPVSSYRSELQPRSLDLHERPTTEELLAADRRSPRKIVTTHHCERKSVTTQTLFLNPQPEFAHAMTYSDSQSLGNHLQDSPIQRLVQPCQGIPHALTHQGVVGSPRTGPGMSSTTSTSLPQPSGALPEAQPRSFSGASGVAVPSHRVPDPAGMQARAPHSPVTQRPPLSDPTHAAAQPIDAMTVKLSAGHKGAEGHKKSRKGQNRVHFESSSVDSSAPQPNSKVPASRHAANSRPRALDLFSGTNSVGDHLKKLGFSVTSLDINPRFSPDICSDICRWEYTQDYYPGYFDLIVASPPCTEYSQAKTTQPRNLEEADRLAKKALEIIFWFKPKAWWVENPRTGLLRTRDFMSDFPYVDVDYCQFADWGYQKPTRIWCSENIAQLPHRVCDGHFCSCQVSTPQGNRHRERLGGYGMRYGTTQKFRVPERLVEYLLSACPKLNPEYQWQTVTPRHKGKSKPRSKSKSQSSPKVTNSKSPKPKVEVPRMVLQDVKAPDSKHPSSTRQLMIRVHAHPAGSVGRDINVLIDTGAEVSLIKSGLFPDQFFQPAQTPVNLVAANGTPLEGGRRDIVLHFNLRKVQNGVEQAKPATCQVVFHEADIQVDAIIGYPWLYFCKVGIFPHHNALAVENPFTLLYGLPQTSRQDIFEGESCEIDTARCNIPPRRKPKGNRRKVRVCQAQATPPLKDTPLESLMEHLSLSNLHIPLQGKEQRMDKLKAHEIRYLARRLLPFVPSPVIHQIQVNRETPPEDPRVSKYREQIFADYKDTVFRENVYPNPPVRGPYGHAFIPLVDNYRPIRQKPMVLHGEKLEAHKKITQKWFDQWYIERIPQGIAPEFLTRTFPVPKKSKDFPWRGVGDFRPLNSQTRHISYPLPVIEDILVKHGRNQMFSAMDLKQAFHQQPLREDSRPLTCCHTPFGMYQWRVNVMGLKNAGQQFQAMVEDRLEPVRDIADPFIDDIVIGSKVEPGFDLIDQHYQDIRRVMDILAKEKLVADWDKCKFFCDEVEFCGSVFGNGVRRPSPGKLMAVQKWELPQTITELRAFLGLTNQYSSYVDQYAEMVAPLQEKLKVPRSLGKKGSKHKIEWKPGDSDQFEAIKRKLSEKLVLNAVNPDKPFVLRADASRYAVGATLEQMPDTDRMPTIEDVRGGKTVPVAFLSRKLTGSQRNWVPREQETYAIILALQKWDTWIGLQPILILTDHKALESWAKEVLDTPSGPVGRRSRWHQIFSRYDLSVGYVPGKENNVCDILSRWAYPASQALRDVSKHGTQEDKEEMDDLIRQEREEEKQCLIIHLHDPRPVENAFLRGVTTRSGRKTDDTPTRPRVDEAGNELEPDETEFALVPPPEGTNTQPGVPMEKSVGTQDSESEDDEIVETTTPL